MTVILQMEPLWGTFETVTALYGVTRRKLLELAKAGTVRARKENPDSRSARIVYRLADVKDWMENEAPTPRAEAFEPRHVGKRENTCPITDEGCPTPLFLSAPSGAGGQG